MQADVNDLPPLRERVSQACDTCKQRKVKCDGKTPCSYCKRRHRERTCRFSPSVRRRRPASETPTTNVSSPSSHTRPATPAATPAGPVISTAIHVSPTLTRHSDVSAEEEAEVPRDARLICDALGRLVFIGDCAPLSLFQTVRQIVTTRVDPHAFSPETSRVSMLENVSSEGLVPYSTTGEPVIHQASIQRLVTTYLTVTSGLVDLFDNNTLISELQTWANQVQRSTDATSAVNYLVLAIGSQPEDEQLATTYFLRGKHLALSTLTGNLSVGTVQSFLLTTLQMLRSCQINAAFLFFGIAARAAYAIGLHRTEVNSRFGTEVHIRRDRLWKSIRVLDLYLSISMGRPPAASDSDCTVPYHTPSELDTNSTTTERYDLLNASVQILSLVEVIVQEVYSRRKISLQLTEGISRQLRDWSDRWLSTLLLRVRGNRENQDDDDDNNNDARDRTGACQVLSSYYYAVMLVSRPFLMYELCRRLPETTASPPRPAVETNGSGSGRTKLANACIDAATLMIGLISDFVAQGPSDRRMPLLVSWLFAASLAVSVGHLANFGRALDKPAEDSISALEYFAHQDAHASQYARIAQSLHDCATSYLARQDAEDRRRIAESSTQLFGLMPKDQNQNPAPAQQQHRHIYNNENRNHTHSNGNTHHPRPNTSSSSVTRTQIAHSLDLASSSWGPAASGPFDDFDPAIFSFGEYSNTNTPSLTDIRLSQAGNHGGSGGYTQEGIGGGSADQVFGAINLFPLLDGNGHIDLAHLL